jgi:molecular chaperone DnaK
MSGAIGIDLGTTNSCMAIRQPGGVRVIENREGAPTTPSVVAHQKTGKWVAGKFAARFAVDNPQHTYHSTKRLIGRQLAEPVVQETRARVGYEIVAADNGAAWIQGRLDKLAPEAIAARVLEKLREDAEAKLGEPITKAVITVPAYFNNAQRAATIAAGKIAGLEVLQILPEPTAAAIAYGVEMAQEDMTIAVYDLGGGTFDISILRVEHGEFETLATAGDAFLGGIDFDAAVAEWTVSRQKFRGADRLLNDAVQRTRIYEEAEAARIDLSYLEQRVISIPHVTRLNNAPVHLRDAITREELEALTADLIDRTRGPCLRALEAAGLAADAIDRLVLVGGVTKMPAVQRMAQSLFPTAKMSSTDPDKIVAIGAAMLAASLDGGQAIKLQDVTPHSVSIETADGSLVELIAAQSKVPSSVTRRVGTAADDQPAVTARIVQGEDLPLGQFHLELGRGPARDARVELTVNLDLNGTVHGQMREIATGRIASAPMTLVAGIDERAIVRLAKAHRKEALSSTADLQRIDDVAEAAAVASTVPPLVMDAPLAPIEPDPPTIEAEPTLPLFDADPAPEPLRPAIMDQDGRISGVDEAHQAEIADRVDAGAELSDALAALGYSLRHEAPVSEPAK